MSKLVERMIALAIAHISLAVALPITPAFSQPVLEAQPARSPTATPTGICPSQLAATLNRISGRSPGIGWGIVVQTQAAPAQRQTLYTQNSTVLLIPASNNKVLTTAAALQRLGASYQIRTTVTGNTSGANLATLRIIGRGDPSLQTGQLSQLAQQLNQRGIRDVALLVGDDTYFRGVALNPNWDADDTLAGYGAPVNSLMVNQNAIGVTLFPQQIGQPLRVQWDDPTDQIDWRLSNRSQTVSTNQAESIDVYRDRTQRLIYVEGQLRVGSAPELAAAAIDNPGNYLVQKFRNALAANQITVRQATVVKATPAPPGEIELAAIASPPLSELIKETNQQSNNIYAEALLKTLGRLQNPNADATSSGVAAIKSILTPLGVSGNQFNIVDGSGLADGNRASATALVQTLQAIALSPNNAAFRASLPIAGQSGTLKDRFRNTIAQGRVSAKTGTITGVVALSGYISPPDYAPLTFSILANYANQSAATVRSMTDEMVLVLTNMRRC
jgi:serine-type D-Ala-D-Ala carboxypeptidase/endopeptidase (penicillin-binding protein 4)